MNKQTLHPRYWASWLGVAMLRLLSLLPYNVMMKLAESLGKLLSKFLKKRQVIARTNIDLCFREKTPAARQQLTDEVMVSMSKGLFETLLAWWAPDKFYDERCRYIGLDLIHHYQKQGRGVLLIGAHYTTLDLSGRAMAKVLDVDLTYKKQKNIVFDDLIRKNREKFFGHVIEKQAMRTMIRNLKKGRCVWYAPDQDFGRQGSVFAPFFGVPAATLTTTGKLVKVTGAKPLYFEHLRLEENGKTIYQSKVTDPFGENFSGDDLENARLINKAIEDSVREYPAQYFWHHERFRTRPDPSDPKLYPKKIKKKKS